MTERDLERVLHESVQDVHLSDAARRRIRLATKEERPVRMKKFVAIVLAVVLMLTTTAAVAAELGLFDFLQKTMGQSVLPGANELVQTNVAYGETDDVTFTVKQAVYDGKSVSLLVEMRAKDEETMLMGSIWSPDEQIGWYESFMEGVEANDERTFVQYSAENGYTRFASASVRINAGDESQIEHWNNNVLTVLYSFSAEGDELALPFEFRSRTYTYDTTYHMDELQRISDEITLTACEPLWTVSSKQSFDAPGFGIRVDGVTITGTPVQSYWTISYTVTDVETARNTPWNANIVDMEKKYIDGGALGMGGSAMPEYNGQQLTYTGAINAMEQPPTELMILLRNWDDHSLNNYFPVTLK
ncbi:MAG: DUF4179 domain-containing protein [Clostridiales bacterium]|nr:DUF4179 domain-containing protein [Clostridiales bacterium]